MKKIIIVLSVMALGACTDKKQSTTGAYVYKYTLAEIQTEAQKGAEIKRLPIHTIIDTTALWSEGDTVTVYGKRWFVLEEQ